LKDAKLKPRRTLTWRKPNAVPVNRKHMMMSACEYIVLGVKGSKAVFNADIDFKEEPEITVQEVIAISDKASTIIDLEIRKALDKLDARPSAARIKEIVNNAIAEAAAAAAERSINIYSENEDSAALCVPNFVNFNSKAGNRLHPTEKPVNLLRYLIELLSKPGDVLLDPFAGSSSLGEAAVISKRSAILVERDEEFYIKGSKRIETLLNSQAQSLFE
jgi:DNA modification methylase